MHRTISPGSDVDMRFRKPPARAMGTQTVLPQPKRLNELFCSIPAEVLPKAPAMGPLRFLGDRIQFVTSEFSGIRCRYGEFGRQT